MQGMLRIGKIVLKTDHKYKNSHTCEQKELVVQEINEMEDTVDMLQGENFKLLCQRWFLKMW